MALKSYLGMKILITNCCHGFLETKFRIINGSQELPEQNNDYKFSECSNLEMVTVSSSFTCLVTLGLNNIITFFLIITLDTNYLDITLTLALLDTS